MKWYFIPRKIFGIDLVIVTLWGLFFCRYGNWVNPFILLFFFVRVAISFEIRKQSPWTLFSAAGFGISYLALAGPHLFLYPIRRMVYYCCCILGKQSEILNIYNADDHNFLIWLHLLNALLLVWLIGIPVFAGIMQWNICRIYWKKTGIWVYAGCCAIIALTTGIATGDVRPFLVATGILICSLPAFYWAIYQRQGQSLIEVMFNNAPIRRYALCLVILLGYLTIGKQDVLSYKIFGLIIMPAICYILLCQWNHIKPILTRHAACLSVAGLLYCFAMNAPQWIKISAICTSIILSVYVAFDMCVQSKKKWIGFVVVFIIGAGSPVLLGINPYLVTDAEQVDKYHCDFYANDGYYIIHKKGKVGLRDRFDKVIDPEFSRLTKLDQRGRFISVEKSAISLEEKLIYGIFDLQSRKFIVDPDKELVSDIIPKGRNTYVLLDVKGREAATLYLPGASYDSDKYVGYPTIIRQ